MPNQVYHIPALLDALCAAVDTARIAATNDSRWLNAIDSGYSWLLEQDAITFDAAAHELTFTSESGETYHANGACQCKAFAQHNACRHRAAARLVRRALETQAEAQTELEALAFELFTTTYGLDWQGAYQRAAAQLSGLLSYADGWNAAAVAA